MGAMSGCVAAHGESERPPAPENTCEIASALRDEALGEAFVDEPRCQTDDDCVVLSASIRCENVLTLTDCGFPVHRQVAQRYAADHVEERVCEAVAEARYGCQLQPLCAGPSEPACVAGQCTRR